jgi:thiosulfate dehydrogenase [quinone] large subunit
MSERTTLRTDLLGRSVEFEYAESWVGYSLFGLRVVMGWVLFQGGIVKVLDPTWTAAGYLQNVPQANPFRPLFVSMAGLPLVDALNAWGLTLTGLALLVGAFVRWSAFWGAVMMLFYWAASLQGGLAAGLPIAHGWVVDDHVVYAALLFGLGAFGSGRILGVDAWLERTSVVESNPWLRYLLG